MKVALALSLITGGAAALSTNSKAGQALLSQARRLADEGGDFSFVGDYSIKFQGCHHVQQWNSDADEEANGNGNNNDNGEDQVRIMTKRLVRFRLCPMDSCNSERSSGCSSKYGDYIVDMNTFVSYYMQGMADEKESVCANVDEYCAAQCQNGDDYDTCLDSCYEEYDASFCLEEDLAETYGFEVNNYAECGKTDFAARRNDRNLNQEIEYYIGPFCAEQGGEVHLGLFTDDTCTTRSDDETFEYFAGYTLPFSDDSLIPNRCLKCGYKNENGEYQANEACSDIYQMSGKCETKMNVDYPNESSCDYIEGIKIIREDGVIRTNSTRKSKTAAVFIGVFITLSVLLAGYVFYLRTKLSRAQINLAASHAPLT